MTQKIKIAGLLCAGALAGALATASLQSVARNSTIAPLPLHELEQFAAVFGMIKSDYVEPVDEKKLITDAIICYLISLWRAGHRLLHCAHGQWRDFPHDRDRKSVV